MTRMTDYLGKARELRARRLGGLPLTPAPSFPDQDVPDAALRTDSSRSTIKATRYHALITTEELLELIALLEDAQRVALDTETYPMDDANSALDPRRGKVILISVAAEGDVGGVVDVTKVDPAPLLDVLRAKTLITHNGKFDLSFLKNQFGYEHDGPVADTQVFDALLYYAYGPRKEVENWKGFPANDVYRRSLKDVVADYLSIELDKAEQTSDFGHEDLTEAQVRYSLRDAEILLPLLEEMLRRLQRLGLQEVANLETRVTLALAYCENTSFALDIEGWRRHVVTAKEEIVRLEAECDAAAPSLPDGATRERWNWGSTTQIGEALELLGARLPKNKKRSRKTDETTLKAISSPKEAVQLAEGILEFRAVCKQASTWGISWFDPPKKKPKGTRFDKKHQFVVDGRVYGSFNQVVKTGRMSCSQPNLQNVPPDLRRYFVAPPGRKLLIADYKHIELVPAAVVSGEEKMLEAFRQGVDVHSLTARRIVEVASNRGDQPASEEEIASFRPLAKLVAIAVLYGSTARGLAKSLSQRYGKPFAEERTQFLIDLFFETYPSLAGWYKREIAKADAGDDLTRTLTGRLRLLDVERRGDRWSAKRQVRLNTPIQGSAGDGFKYALSLTWERRRDCPGDPKVVNLVHDEIVAEIDEEYAQAGKAWLEQCMIDGMAEVVGPNVPVSVEITIGDSWANKGMVETGSSTNNQAIDPAEAHPGEPGSAASGHVHNPAKEEQAVEDQDDDEPVRIQLYLDHRDGAVDNYPVIVVCDECADGLGGEVGELTRLELGAAAVCEECLRRNAAAMRVRIT